MTGLPLSVNHFIATNKTKLDRKHVDNLIRQAADEIRSLIGLTDDDLNDPYNTPPDLKYAVLWRVQRTLQGEANEFTEHELSVINSWSPQEYTEWLNRHTSQRRTS